jgi:ribosome-associated protein
MSDASEKAQRIVEAALDRKADDVVTLDVHEVSSFTDVFVLATGTSDRHVRSVADAIEAALKESDGPPAGVEGYDEGLWVLIDFGDVVVHVFQHEVRVQYDLERLWSDAAEVHRVPPESGGVL